LSLIRPSPAFRRESLELLLTLATALALAVALRVLLFQPYTIPSSSMEPGLVTGDYLIVSKFPYGWSRASLPLNPQWPHGRLLGHGPKRGDVVVFLLPRDESWTYVKRVIGLPGDRVQVIGGAVYVNGRAVPRTPIGETFDHDDPGRRVMRISEPRPDGKPYVTFGGEPDHDGENTGVYVVPRGRYFMMGDNRENSLDSRWPREVGVGFVPAENIVGRAQIVLASWKPGVSLLKPWTWITHLDVHRLLKPVI
jgi:signal peptidase I